MYSQHETLRAIGRVMAGYAQHKAAEMDADGMIEAAPLLKPWKAGTHAAPAVYAAGDVRTDANQPWRCVQAHTHSGEEGWNPAASRALWAPYHAKKKAYALPWVAPTCAEDAYNAGEYMVWTDGSICLCKGSAVTYGPDVSPDSWEVQDVQV